MEGGNFSLDIDKDFYAKVLCAALEGKTTEISMRGLIRGCWLSKSWFGVMLSSHASDADKEFSMV